MSNNVGDSLRNAIPVSNSPIEDLWGEAQDNTQLFSPATILSFPHAYINRSGNRVDIYGIVDPTTLEYKEGYRYYDHNACLYYADGRRRQNKDHPEDLHHLISREELYLSQKPVSDEMWVYPQHCGEASFFRSLKYGFDLVNDDCYYLNRMGFLVNITHGDTNSGYYDSASNLYTIYGQRKGASSSMLDLTYEIKNWLLFSKSDWSGEQIAFRQDVADYDPQNFDPVAKNKQILLEELFNTILKARDLSKSLDVTFTFFLDASKLKTS